MKSIFKDFESKLKDLDIIPASEEFSAIVAGFHDLFNGVKDVEDFIKKINSTDSVEQIHQLLIDIQIEIVNHLKNHILDLEKPLMNLINNLEDKYS